MNTITRRRTAGDEVRALLTGLRGHSAAATNSPTFIDVLTEHAAATFDESPAVKPRNPRYALLLAKFFGDRSVADYHQQDSLRFVRWYRDERDAARLPWLDAPRGNPETTAIEMLRLLRRAVHQYGRRHREWTPDILIPKR